MNRIQDNKKKFRIFRNYSSLLILLIIIKKQKGQNLRLGCLVSLLFINVLYKISVLIICIVTMISRLGFYRRTENSDEHPLPVHEEENGDIEMDNFVRYSISFYLFE